MTRVTEPGSTSLLRSTICSLRPSITALKSPSFDSKWFSRVWCDTPASLATAARVTSSYTAAVKAASAAVSSRSRVACVDDARWLWT